MQSKDKKSVYVYILSGKTNDVMLPATITLCRIVLKKKSRIVLLDGLKEKIQWQSLNDGTNYKDTFWVARLDGRKLYCCVYDNTIIF